jgi:hypothetical protein
VSRLAAMRRFLDRPAASKAIFVLSVLALVAFLVVPFQRTCNVTGADTICGYRFSWQGNNSGLLIGAFALSLVIWELLPMLAPRLTMRGWQTAAVTVALAVGLLLATLAKMITDNEFQLAWVWGLLGIALAILAIAILSLRHRWKHRGDAATSLAPLPTA